jgi:DNA modification methylase
MDDWHLLGVKTQMCVTSPPYFGLRDYGVEGQLGLEQTPQEYVDNLVEVFRLVRDLMADDGTLWLNLGDSYAGSGKGAWDNKNGGQKEVYIPDSDSPQTKLPKKWPGIKPKDLIGIPWRVAFALQADGWYLRQDIIWHKPNPMPESIRDRCTKAHEYIFLLSKSPKYYFDWKAMQEPSVTKDARKPYAPGQVDNRGDGHDRNGGSKRTTENAGEFRNRRSVWTVTTKPYKGAHFATFPMDLIEPCVLAGSRPGDIVLDPFMGSGTTAQVALKHGRQYLGCELNSEYEKLQQERIAKVNS